MKKFALILALALVILSFTACSDKGYEEVIENYYLALNEEDGEAALLLYDNYFLEWACEQAEIDFDEDLDDYADKIEEFFEQYHDKIEEDYDEDIDGLNEIKYVIDDVTFYDDEEDFEAITDYLDDKFDYDAKAIEKIALLEIEEIFVGDEDEESEDIEAVVIKIDGEWYICGALLNEDAIDRAIDGEDEEDDEKKAAEELEAAMISAIGTAE